MSVPTATDALGALDAEALSRTVCDLIAIPSLSGEEHDAQQWVADFLGRAGLDVDVWSIDMAALETHPAFSAEVTRTAALGVAATIGRADGSRPALLIDGHVDVVPTGDPAGWSSPPFSPVVHPDGRIVGRGACDTKGGLAAALHAVKAIVDAGVSLRRPLALTSVVGEEDGGSGTLAALTHGVTADACIVLEPTELSVVPAVAGALSFRVTVRGRSAHGALREEGVSAIEKLPIIQRALLDLEATRNTRASDPLFGWLRLPFAICAGRVAGGDWPSSEADWLTLEGRYGVAPGEDLDAARAELEHAIALAAAGADDAWLAATPPTVTWWGGQYLPARTDPDHPLVSTLRDAVATETGHPAVVRGMPYGCDLGVAHAVAAMPGVVFGPGDIRDAHRPDEHVVLADVVTCARSLITTIIRTCGGEP